MKQVLLLFPDAASISDFILHHPVQNAEVNTAERSLVADMNDNDIITAVGEYGGFFKTEIRSPDPSC